MAGRQPGDLRDVAYGISRTFATDVIAGRPDRCAGRPGHPAPDGRHEHLSGPYATGAAATKGQAAFDKAVACKGQQIVFTLSSPLSDFNELVSQPASAR